MMWINLSLYFICFSFLMFLTTMIISYCMEIHFSKILVKFENFFLFLLITSGLIGAFFFILGVLVMIFNKIVEVL